MVPVESPQAKIGKFTLQVKLSESNRPQWQQRSEALTAWLLRQWHKQQAQRN
jgi:hypothetical protein